LGPAAQRKIPESLWRYAMLPVLAAAVVESAVSSRYLGTQREEG